MSLIILIAATLGLVSYVIYVIRLGSINWIAFFLIVAVIAGSGYFEARHYIGVNQLNYLLVNTTGQHRVEVKCQRVEQTIMDLSLKQAYRDEKNEKVIRFKYDICNGLIDWLNSDMEHADSETTYHFYAFLHMAGYLLPEITTPGQASCYAESKYVEAAVLAGTTEGEAVRMYDDYKQNWYPTLPDSYKTQC